MLTKIPTRILRTYKDPANADVTTYFALVNLRDLPVGIPTGVCPVEVNMDTPAALALMDAVSDDDPNFSLYNTGITLVAKGVKFDSTNSTLTIDFGDDDTRYGLIDGAHAYEAIKRRRNLIPKGIDKYVRLEILTGELDVDSVADARNAILRAPGDDLAALEPLFPYIHGGVEDEPYAEDIDFHGDGDKRLPVSTILRLMYAFNVQQFPDDEDMPVAAYSSRAIVVKDIKGTILYKGEAYVSCTIYEALTDFLPQLAHVVDMVQEGAASMEDSPARAVDGAHTMFGNKPIGRELPDGYLWPMVGAFRALMADNDREEREGFEPYWKWAFDPEDVWARAGEKLVRCVAGRGLSASKAGRSVDVWRDAYRIVAQERAELEAEAAKREAEAARREVEELRAELERLRREAE